MDLEKSLLIFVPMESILAVPFIGLLFLACKKNSISTLDCSMFFKVGNFMLHEGLFGLGASHAMRSVPLVILCFVLFAIGLALVTFALGWNSSHAYIFSAWVWKPLIVVMAIVLYAAGSAFTFEFLLFA